jgi:hypothetical protein
MLTRLKGFSSFFLEDSGIGPSGGKKRGNFLVMGFSNGLYTDRDGLGLERR